MQFSVTPIGSCPQPGSKAARALNSQARRSYRERMATLPRLYIEARLEKAVPIQLDEAQSNYLLRVLRMGLDDPLLVFNGQDGEWTAAVTGIRSRLAEVSPVGRLRAPPAVPAPEALLLFAPVKKDQTDLIVEKATELGMSAIWPVLTARSQTRVVRADRFRRIAIEACEQSERLDLPAIAGPFELSEAVERLPQDCALVFCDETRGGEAAAPVASVLAQLAGRNAALLIGPEGGFAPQERAFLRSRAGVMPVSLGPRILKAETAAIAVMALWQALCGDPA